jgi:two-component system, LuxR family, sensor kinase FixL
MIDQIGPEQFYELLESAPDAIVIVDEEGLIRMVNRQAEIMFGYPRTDMLMRHIEMLLPGSLRSTHVQHRAHYIENPHTRPMGAGLDLLAVRRDSSIFPVEISLSPLHMTGGILITSVIRDITERKRAVEAQQRVMRERLSTAEAGMLQAARLAAIGQLSAAIAHEINNPLYAARNALYLIEGDLTEEQRASPYWALVRNELARIAGIIDRMRDFYRPTRGEVQFYDLNRTLEETLALIRLNIRNEAIMVDFVPDQQLPPVLCDNDQMRQVFLNLMMNAIEAMPEGGKLSVRSRYAEQQAIIEVSDTGIGIPKAIMPQLFEAFFTNKQNGTGLGLTISAHIVTQHNGRITAESVEGEGSLFRVILPIS